MPAAQELIGDDIDHTAVPTVHRHVGDNYVSAGLYSETMSSVLVLNDRGSSRIGPCEEQIRLDRALSLSPHNAWRACLVGHHDFGEEARFSRSQISVIGQFGTSGRV